MVFSKADKRFLAVIFVVHAVFFLLAWHYGCIYNGDSEEYVLMAKNISKGWLYAGDLSNTTVPELLTLRPPGYPFFMWLVYVLHGTDWFILLLQNGVSIFNIWYLRKTLLRIGFDTKFDWVLLLFVMLYPSQYINANTIAPDLLLQTTTVLYFGSFVKFLQDKQTKQLWLMSIWLIVGVMIKPVLLPFIYVNFVVLLIAGVVNKNIVRYSLIAALPVAIVLLYCGFNQQRTGKFHFSSTQSFNAVFYYFDYYKEVQDPDKAVAFLNTERDTMSSMPVYSDRYDYAVKRGRQLLKENFQGFVFFDIKGGLRMLIDPGKGEMDMFTGRLSLKQLYNIHDTSGFYATLKSKGINGLKDYVARNPSFFIAMLVLLGNVLRVMGLLLFLSNKNVNFYLRVFVLLFTAYFVFIAGAIAHVRYFMPVSLIVMSCAAIGWQHWLSRQNKSVIVKA